MNAQLAIRAHRIKVGDRILFLSSTDPVVSVEERVTKHRNRAVIVRTATVEHWYRRSDIVSVCRQTPAP